MINEVQVREFNAEMADELVCLVQAMKSAELWPTTPPSQQAMHSTVPFAVDSMPFESWLAFIFIPKMQCLLDSGNKVPEMQIYTAAELYLNSGIKGRVEGFSKDNADENVEQRVYSVLECLKRIDDIAALASKDVN